jgi:hypothetical protein
MSDEQFLSEVAQLLADQEERLAASDVAFRIIARRLCDAGLLTAQMIEEMTQGVDVLIDETERTEEGVCKKMRVLAAARALLSSPSRPEADNAAG